MTASDFVVDGAGVRSGVSLAGAGAEAAEAAGGESAESVGVGAGEADMMGEEREGEVVAGMI
jgi:hypothetical protein